MLDRNYDWQCLLMVKLISSNNSHSLNKFQVLLEPFIIYMIKLQRWKYFDSSAWKSTNCKGLKDFWMSGFSWTKSQSPTDAMGVSLT
jgi:hypothetical protein